MHRDLDSIRPPAPVPPSHFVNLPLPSVSNYSIRPSVVIPGHFNMVPPPTVPSQQTSLSTTSSFVNVNETMSVFHKERLQDVLQHGVGSYVFIDHFGLVPKLNHF